MSKAQLFNQYHGRQIILAFVVVVAVIGWQVSQEEAAIKKQKTGLVMGATTSQETAGADDKEQAAIIYQGALKSQLAAYLRQRATKENQPEELSILIKETKEKVLTLSVPDVYKDLQLKVVLALDNEQQGLDNNDQEKKQQAEKYWEEILEQYFWLNS